MKISDKTRQNISVALGLALLGGALWIIQLVVRFVWTQFVHLPPELAVGLLTAASTVLVATGTVVLGRSYERQRETESHFRARKVEIYDEFLKELFKVFRSSETTGLTEFLSEWQRKMIVWGGSAVFLRYITWMKHLQSTEPNAESFFKMGDLFLEMRKDLGLSNKDMSRQTFAHTILKNSELLLAMAKGNPNVTLAEMTEMEKVLAGEKS